MVSILGTTPLINRRSTIDNVIAGQQLKISKIYSINLLYIGYILCVSKDLLKY
jgi:hypothetical protein